jgi:hypothetical protein
VTTPRGANAIGKLHRAPGLFNHVRLGPKPGFLEHIPHLRAHTSGAWGLRGSESAVSFVVGSLASALGNSVDMLPSSGVYAASIGSLERSRMMAESGHLDLHEWIEGQQT